MGREKPFCRPKKEAFFGYFALEEPRAQRGFDSYAPARLSLAWASRFERQDIQEGFMEEDRPTADQVLEAVARREREGRRGKLKIFLGMCAGVGKTYAMLQAAHAEKALGRDVVIGYVETHGRPETEALVQGLPVIPRKEVNYRGITLQEMDLDAILARRPELVLVDELAHTNAPGLRHPKRYQDVLEILEQGIDVFSTLNVQHLESRAEIVREITGVPIEETVPDSILDEAEIELIDLPPEDLRRRLAEGKVYVPEKARQAAHLFFREGNLYALREIALRVAAEKAGKDVRDYMRLMRVPGPWKTGHKLLVAVSPSPYSESLIRWTRRLADSWQCPWVAVYVDKGVELGPEATERLTRNLALARALGAEVVTVADQDLVEGILRTARQHNITQIVVGKPGAGSLWGWLRGQAFLRRLLEASGAIDVLFVREEPEGGRVRPSRPRAPLLHSPWYQYGWATAAVVIGTVLGLLVEPWFGYRSISFLYLSIVLSLALWVGRGPVVWATLLSAVLWDYLFVPPRFSLAIASWEDAVTLAFYLVISGVLGSLVARIRLLEEAARKREKKAVALLLWMRELAGTFDLGGIVRVLVKELDRTFQAKVAVFALGQDGVLPQQPHPESSWCPPQKEQAVALWAFHHARAAGRFTDNLPLAEGTYLPLRASGSTLGVLGIKVPEQARFTLEDWDLLEALAGQAALALDRLRLEEKARRVAVLEESEKLGRALLDSASHELKIPITTVQAAASALAHEGDPKTLALAREIQEAARRLDRIVGELLDSASLQSGHLQVKKQWCYLGEIVSEALARLEPELKSRPVSVNIQASLPLVRADPRLLERALENLLLNAQAYTPEGTPIEISAQLTEETVELVVRDWGSGVPEEAKEKVFEKFYRLPGSPPGGTGLGLAIVKGFMEAQGGSVRLENAPGGGARFVLSLPREKEPHLDKEADTLGAPVAVEGS
jgi:two-component system sensor histidine kinase KdpD